ncbi:MAG: recombinase family protein [Gammaproteobacteria bacterium]|nr:recombinase family protein [Gammaproteobacteria bacterium]
MSETIKRRLRCAVYTRKSTEEGLDQEYNSIDAQRDAGHAYIASQRAEGWIPVADDYDDPAYSGGNMDRPAVRRLLADIEAGKVDIVVVYKIDRLTRSLTDFSRMIEVFERHGVSFVSVTQQFNTTTSMGRLMLNILLSFAQFECEVTGERIRDKIAASKRKGMWMGGVPPLGYDVENRRLVPNEREAKVVRHIFQRFVELGSSTSLVKELRLDGVTSKAWTTQDGRVREGKLIDKSLVYKILSNRVYLGEIRHRDQWYPGEHTPIVERGLWDAARAILDQNPRVRANNTRARVPFLLKGIVEGYDGRALTPWFTRKKSGRIYRYYLPTRENKEHAGASGLPRLPAAELEAAVLEQMRRVLRAPDMVTGVAERAARLDPSLDEAQVAVAMTRLDAIWDQLFPAEQQRIVRLLIDKVIVSPNDIEVRFRPNGIDRLALELRPEPARDTTEEAVA